MHTVCKYEYKHALVHARARACTQAHFFLVMRARTGAHYQRNTSTMHALNACTYARARECVCWGGRACVCTHAHSNLIREFEQLFFSSCAISLMTQWVCKSAKRQMSCKTNGRKKPSCVLRIAFKARSFFCFGDWDLKRDQVDTIDHLRAITENKFCNKRQNGLKGKKGNVLPIYPKEYAAHCPIVYLSCTYNMKKRSYNLE